MVLCVWVVGLECYYEGLFGGVYYVVGNFEVCVV